MELATFAAGCFWCTEAIFKRLKGVTDVQSGYTGGETQDPGYEAVSSGHTGHAEAIQINFDLSQISFSTLLDIFFATHDPTTMNRQGADVGSQYRSAVFYHTESQKKETENKIAEINNSGAYKDQVVTQVIPFTQFFTAEKYHQNYYEKNPSLPYCQIVINPKLTKLLEKFSSQIKPEYKSSA